jgi:hypothetical protein
MPQQTFSATIIRPKDLLVLSCDFINVVFDPPQPGVPGKITGATNALLVIHFQPQHIAEQAFYQTSDFQQTKEEKAAGQPPPPGNESPTIPGSVQSRLSGPSRLVFSVPSSETIPFTVEDLLESIKRLPLNVTAVASFDPSSGCSPLDLVLRSFKIPAPPKITVPNRFQTAIELPYRLLISPDHLARWMHANQPVTLNDWTELWHTRLGSQRPDGDPRVRAVWSPDYDPNNLQSHTEPPVPFRMSLDQRDRNELVRLTSDYTIQSFWPSPVNTEQLMLTTLGAWLKVQGFWEPPSLGINKGSLTVEEWRHVATMARDHYVRVMYAGYLFPFGHRASLVKVTERKFYYEGEGKSTRVVAYLFQRMFIIVREPTRTYDNRTIPFRTVTFKTRITPNLDLPANSDINGLTQEAFWPRVAVGGNIEDFQFHLQATDWENRVVEFTTPVIFVSKNVDENNTFLSGVITHYNMATDPTNSRRQRDFHGQSVAYAPSNKPNDTSLETATLSFGAQSQPSTTPRFLPTMARAQVDIPAVKQLTGSPAPSTIQWEPTYTAASGNTIGNAGQIFVNVANTPLNFGSTDKVGGMVTPNIGISGLSRALGPMGGPVNQIVTGNFKPMDIFPSDVKLFGGIELRTIIKDLIYFNAANTDLKVPQFVSVREGDIIRTSYKWNLSQTELVNTGLFVPQAGSTFSLEAIVEKKLDNSPPTFSINGQMTNFQLVLLPAPNDLIGIAVNSVKFTAGSDSKVDVAVQMGEMKFRGILEFVNELSNFIPLDGFNDPPSLDLVGPPNPGLNLGFSMGIPTIALGMMTMQNISLAAGFFLPFGDQPMNFHFAFCEKEQPFILTVSLFGGGGFFAIDIGPDHVVMVEAALEFGASAAINLGVAKGKASMMAGFYFQKAGADFTLSGFFRANGNLSVLGIVSVSLEFYLGLTYASKGISPHGGTLWGQAKLTVEIEVLFFSTSVSVSMEREFAGSDPYFRQLISPSAWVEYCEAFADYA